MPTVPLAIARYTLLEGLRNRLLWLVGALVVAGFALAEFVAEVAITETAGFQSGLLGATLRGGAVLVTALFVCSSMVRELSDKVVELVLARPITRASYLLGKLAGFAALGVLVAAVAGLCLAVYAPPAQAALWAASLACELVLVVALSLLCLFTFSQVTAAFSAVVAFYVLARSISAIQLIAHSPLLHSDSPARRATNAFVDGLARLLPDLDRFTPSSWLIHHDGSAADLGPIAAQTAIYLVVLGAAALFDLYRKTF